MAKDPLGGRSRLGYRGLFSPTPATSTRAYCFLASLSGGVLLLTTGSVLCHVISRHPESGGRPMHTPSLSLAVSLIVTGVVMVCCSVVMMCRGGVDYADDLYEDGTQGFCSEDELDQLYQKHLQQQLLLQRLIEEQLQKERNNHCSCCEASNSKAKCITPTISPKDKTANQCLSEGTSSVLSKHAEGCNSLACSRKSEDRCSALRNLYPPSKESSCQCFLPNNRCKLCCQNTQRNYEPSSNCRESSACRAHCEFCSSSRCHHSDHHTKPASNCSNHHQDITNTSAASQQIYSSKSLSSSPRQPTAMTSRRLPTQASSSKPPPLSPSLQLLMTTDNSLQKSQGLNNQTDVNQTSLQRKMPSKIITTMDEICVVIDS